MPARKNVQQHLTSNKFNSLKCYLVSSEDDDDDHSDNDINMKNEKVNHPWLEDDDNDSDEIEKTIHRNKQAEKQQNRKPKLASRKKVPIKKPQACYADDEENDDNYETDEELGIEKKIVLKKKPPLKLKQGKPKIMQKTISVLSEETEEDEETDDENVFKPIHETKRQKNGNASKIGVNRSKLSDEEKNGKNDDDFDKQFHKIKLKKSENAYNVDVNKLEPLDEEKQKAKQSYILKQNAEPSEAPLPSMKSTTDKEKLSKRTKNISTPPSKKEKHKDVKIKSNKLMKEQNTAAEDKNVSVKTICQQLNDWCFSVVPDFKHSPIATQQILEGNLDVSDILRK